MAYRGRDVLDVPGMGWRVSLSIVEAIGWLIFLVIWFFFYAQTLGFYQNIAVVVVSVAVLGITEGFTWTPMWWDSKTPGFERAVALEAALGLLALVFAFAWLYFFADSTGLYMNIAIIIIPLALWGVAQSIAHRWWREHEERTSIWALGLVVGLIWAAFLFIWFYYFATGYSLFENFGIFALSGIILGGLQALLHAPWRTMKSMGPGYGWRVALSIVMGIGFVAFFILWFGFLGVGYTAYQNIAVLLISILIVAAVLGVAWAPWGIKYARKYKKK